MLYRFEKLNGRPVEANVDVTRAAVQAAPEYHSSSEFSRAHETNLFRHYHREGYWQ